MSDTRDLCFLVAIVLAFCFNVAFTEEPQFANSLTRCERNRNFNKCLRNNLILLKPHIIEGIPEWNTPSLDPLFIKDIDVVETTGPVSVKFKIRDMYIRGVRDIVFQNVTMNTDTLKTYLKMYIPDIRTLGKYDIDGRLLLLPIRGKGDMQANITGLDINCVVQLSIAGEGSNRKAQTKSIHVKFSLDNVRLHFSNLFDGNKILGDTINSFLNERALDLLQDIKPILTNVVNSIAKDIVNSALGSVPIDRLADI